MQLRPWLSLVLPRHNLSCHDPLHWRLKVGWPWRLLLVMALAAFTVATVDEPGTGLVLHAVPSTDGYEIWVWAEPASGTESPISGLLCESISGRCRTMTCDPLGCSGALIGLPAGTTVVGQMSVTLTLSSWQTLESGPLPFTRAFAPALELTDVVSPDNLAELTLFPDSLPADTYLLILTNSTSPGPLPPAHRLVGRSYSVRASGAITWSDRPMALRLAYDSLWLDSAPSHNLSIFAWDPLDQTWEEKGGTLFTDQHYLSTPIQGFTTYALMEIPAWRDTFADTSGLSVVEGTSPTPKGGLILNDNALSGTAISIPIMPTTAIASWDRVVFTHTTASATTVTVDLLALDGSEVLTNVISGASLTSLVPTEYPGLRLRANLSSQVAGETPVLDQWKLGWQVTKHKVYLPVVMK